MTTYSGSYQERTERERARAYAYRAKQAGREAVPTLSGFVESTAAVQLESWQQLICTRLERMIGERGQRLLIHGPPQYGKSLIISQRFPAYALLTKPTLRLRVACYNVSHAERFSKVNLNLMRDGTLQSRYGASGATVPPVAPANEWSTEARAALLDANPSFVALGLGSGFTGLGVDILVIDDPYKNAQEARSQAVNVMVWDWWRNVVVPRLNPDANVVVMFHRWWEGDFAGQLIEQGGWETMRFPAIADGGADDPTGREAGELLSPRFSREHLDKQRRTMGTDFEALYQGTPYPAEGGLFKAGKAVIVDAAPIGGMRVRYWDKAGASPGKGDYTVGVLMNRCANGFYWVEDVQRGQWPAHERNPIMRETAERDRQTYGHVPQVIEQPPGLAKESTDAVIRYLAGYPVSADPVHRDKVERAEPLAAQWNAGNVRIVKAPWNVPYLDELFAFPNGNHDDQVDGSSGGFNYLATAVRASFVRPRTAKPNAFGGLNG